MVRAPPSDGRRSWSSGHPVPPKRVYNLPIEPWPALERPAPDFRRWQRPFRPRVLPNPRFGLLRGGGLWVKAKNKQIIKFPFVAADKIKTVREKQ